MHQKVQQTQTLNTRNKNSNIKFGGLLQKFAAEKGLVLFKEDRF